MLTLIQFEFLRQLSADPANLVIGLVRNKPATEAKVSQDLKRENIRIVEGDLADYDSIKVSLSRPSKTHCFLPGTDSSLAS
jgi:hypothetical protein